MKPRLLVVVLTVSGVLLGAPVHAAYAQRASRAAPPPSIPTVALTTVARPRLLYASGKCVGEPCPGQESTIGDATYVEVKSEFLGAYHEAIRVRSSRSLPGGAEV